MEVNLEENLCCLSAGKPIVLKKPPQLETIKFMPIAKEITQEKGLQLFN